MQETQCLGLLISISLHPKHFFFSRKWPIHKLQFIPHGAIILEFIESTVVLIIFSCSNITANALRVFTSRSRRKNLVEQTLSWGFALLWKFKRIS